MYVDVEQAGTMQDFIVRYEVVPSDVQDASLAPYMEWIQFIPVVLYEGHSVRMSRTTNDGLMRSGTGCFMAVPIWQQWASKG